MTRVILVATVMALTAGCRHEGLPPTTGGADMATSGPGPFGPQAHQDVDILFVVDNSPSTAPKQAELRARFTNFAAALDDAAAATHPASYHIGVITSDLGAGPYTLNNGQCHPAGDGARLHVTPATGVTGLPAACDANFHLDGGVRFIDYNQLARSDNLRGVALTTAFSCMSAAGDLGCGIESPLESAYRALHDFVPENEHFLRPDALLVVIFVTDEDDCSVPNVSDLFDPNNHAVGVLHSFRCTEYGIVCGDPPMPVAAASSNGPLSDCRPRTAAEGGKLIDVEKYINYFTQPASRGGVKVDPTDVILAAVAAPVEPFRTIDTTPCADSTTVASCAILDHSCVRANDLAFFADPAVRLSTVVRSAATSQIMSICDGSAADAGLAAVAQKIVARLQ